MMKKELNVNDTPFNKKNCEKGFILCGLIISMIKLMKVKKNCLFRSSAKSFAKICVKKKIVWLRQLCICKLHWFLQLNLLMIVKIHMIEPPHEQQEKLLEWLKDSFSESLNMNLCNMLAFGHESNWFLLCTLGLKIVYARSTY